MTTGSKLVRSPRTRKSSRFLHSREMQIGILVVLMILILLLKKAIFLDVNNLDSLQANISPSLLIGIGMTVLMISGVFDLSVGSIMGLAGVVTSIFLANNTAPAISVGIGLCVGIAFGIVNGLLVGILRLNHLIVTIGTMTIGRGLTIVLLRGDNRFGIGGFPEIVNKIGNAKVLDLYMMTWLALALAFAVQFVLLRVGAGRKLYYVGGNREVAELFGVKVERVRLSTFVLCDFLAALAGILVVMRIGASARYLGDGLELKIIISCLIGGVSLIGGRGSIVAAALGISFMTLVTNSFSIFEIGAYWQDIIVGLILIVVVTLDAYIATLRNR